MTEFGEAARAEVNERYPAWRDIGVGVAQGNRYRSGFVDGAEWAENRLRGSREAGRAELKRAKQDLEATHKLFLTEVDSANASLAKREKRLADRESLMLDEAARNAPIEAATRDRAVLRITEILDNAPIEFSSEGLAVIANPHALAKEILNKIITPSIAGVEDSAQIVKAMREKSTRASKVTVKSIGLPLGKPSGE